MKHPTFAAMIFLLLSLIMPGYVVGAQLEIIARSLKSPFACSAPKQSLALRSAMTDPLRFIAHAGGGIDGIRYTNSLEAVQQSIRTGYKLIELDLITTSDGHIVAAHDWDHWKEITGSELNHPTLNQFMAARIRGKYTPLDAKKINELFRLYPDIYLVTDKIRDFKKLNQTFDFQDRILVEVFSIAEYINATQHGLKYPMLSLEASGSDAALKAALSARIPMVVLSTKNILKWKAGLRQMRERGVCIFAFSSNEPAFISSHIDALVHGFYTDYWNLKSGTCKGSDCTTY